MEAKKEETGKNTAIENIFARKSVRTYTPQPIEKEKVDLLVKAAMAAPTAVNKQPWAFVVVDDRKVLDKLAAELPYAKMTAQAPLAIVVCGDLSKALNGETDRYWMLDCSAASENLLLAAESMGLRAVAGAGRAGLGLHLNDVDRRAEQVFLALCGPFVDLFRHRRGRRDRVDRRYLGERIGAVRRRRVAVHNSIVLFLIHNDPFFCACISGAEPRLRNAVPGFYVTGIEYSRTCIHAVSQE